MYVPPHFAVTDVRLLEAALHGNPFATLVTCGPGGLMANHVPLLYVPYDAESAAACGTLHGHVARANAQWREIESGTEVLAIFSGPDAYVSPTAYATKREHGKVVPTWNYVVVHASGTGRTYDDPARLHALVSRLTDVHEAARGERWAVADAPEAFVAGQLRGIVGIEIAVTRLVGKWKLNQNRSDADRHGVIADLAASSEAADRATAAAMSALEPRD
ncbi:MAG: FMN-binding negative transcriptional regulator [Vulcanimicrobiaceae bacterium]